MPFQADPSTLLLDKEVVECTQLFASSAPFAVPEEEGICVLQSEVALVYPVEGKPLPRFLGSVDATTCCAVFVRSSDGQKSACAHIDFEQCCACFSSILERGGFFSDQALTVSLVGSYQGGEECEELVACILRSLHALSNPLTLRVAAVLGANPLAKAEGSERQRPAFFSAAMDTATGELRPATFASHGPCAIERASKCFIQGCKEPLALAYDSSAGWSAPILPGAQGGLEWGIPKEGCIAFLQFSDERLLQSTSTSPNAEGPEYASNMRRVLSFILQQYSK